MDWVKNIQRCFDFDRVFYTQHARVEMRNEVVGEIKDNEVYEAIRSVEVIQEYPEDKPYPSALMFGRTYKNRPLHILCAYSKDEDLTIVITVYHPNPKLWIDYRRRRT